MKYGNFSTSDPAFGVGSVAEFTCEPGYTLEQGAVILECVNYENPQWNETEPACRGEQHVRLNNSLIFILKSHSSQ